MPWSSCRHRPGRGGSRYPESGGTCYLVSRVVGKKGRNRLPPFVARIATVTRESQAAWAPGNAAQISPVILIMQSQVTFQVIVQLRVTELQRFNLSLLFIPHTMASGIFMPMSTLEEGLHLQFVKFFPPPFIVLSILMFY